MPYVTVSLPTNTPPLSTDVIATAPHGTWIAVRISPELSIYIPGYDSDAVVNARQWAKALTEAADQIVAKLEAETVAEVV